MEWRFYSVRITREAVVNRVEEITQQLRALSSSELRDRLAAGRSVDYLIPTPAIRCISRLGLYAESR